MLLVLLVLCQGLGLPAQFWPSCFMGGVDGTEAAGADLVVLVFFVCTFFDYLCRNVILLVGCWCCFLCVGIGPLELPGLEPKGAALCR